MRPAVGLKRPGGGARQNKHDCQKGDAHGLKTVSSPFMLSSGGVILTERKFAARSQDVLNWFLFAWQPRLPGCN